MPADKTSPDPSQLSFVASVDLGKDKTLANGARGAAPSNQRESLPAVELRLGLSLVRPRTWVSSVLTHSSIVAGPDGKRSTPQHHRGRLQLRWAAKHLSSVNCTH